MAGTDEAQTASPNSRVVKPRRHAVREWACAAALGVSVTLLLLVVFSPSWVAFRAWRRVPEVFAQVIAVRRGAYVAMQVADPSVEIHDPIHKIVRWRLLLPMVGHQLGMTPAMVLGLGYVGCVLVLTTIVRLGRRRGASWGECALLTIVAGAGAWFFTSTGWLGYYDSWLVLGLLTVAWARTRWLLWLACVLTPWVDERFVLGFPLAVLVRWISSSGALPVPGSVRGLLRDVSVATVLVAGYATLRLWLAGRGGSQTVAEYWRGVDAHVPLWRFLFGGWEGLRVGWPLVFLAVILLLRRQRIRAAGLLALGVVGTTLAGFASANDLSRSVAPVLAVVPLGWELARTERWWMRRHVSRILAGAALLPPRTT